MNLKNQEIRVKVNWRPTGGEPSPAWRRLIAKLVASGKEKPTSTGEAAANGESKDAEKQDL